VGHRPAGQRGGAPLRDIELAGHDAARQVGSDADSRVRRCGRRRVRAGMVAWFFWLRRRTAGSAAYSHLDRRALLAGGIGSLALLAPSISTGVMPLERHTEGTVIAFLRTTMSSA